jgi:hypothetical protein
MPTRRTSHPAAAGSHAQGSPLREIEKLLRERFSDLKSSLDEALDPKHGESVLDLLLGDQRGAVAWSSKRGFGVSSHSDSELGQRPDEVYTAAAEASERIKSLLSPVPSVRRGFCVPDVAKATADRLRAGGVLRANATAERAVAVDPVGNSVELSAMGASTDAAG